MSWTKEELKEILQKDFIDNQDAFITGRRNNDMVDSMCICFALDEEWTEMYAKRADNFLLKDDGAEYFDKYLVDHYERVKKWLDQKEANGYVRGEVDIMNYAINY